MTWNDQRRGGSNSAMRELAAEEFRHGPAGRAATAAAAAATPVAGGERRRAAAGARGAAGGRTARSRAVAAVVNGLFWPARWTWAAPFVRELYVRAAAWCFPAIARAAAANGRRIFGPGVSRRRLRGYQRAVTANFYDFIYDVGRAARAAGREELLGRVEAMVGTEDWDAARAAGRGAIVVTAHMGSYEAGMAALSAKERAVHVVFKRDARDGFESIRTAMRRRLGVIEEAIDDGWPMWARLRDALARDEVVMMQGDRVMPGQKGQTVPFLHGHLSLPVGPMKLAAISGAPIVPVFVLRTAGGNVRIHVEKAIVVDPGAAAGADGVHPAVRALGGVLERYVRENPEQWLVLHPAFVEDAVTGEGA